MSDNERPLIGSRRVRPVFLWFPRRLSGELRFFGWHRVCQEYLAIAGHPGYPIGTRVFCWIDDHWYTSADTGWGREKYPMGDD
jgi:hypothetical protein